MERGGVVRASAGGIVLGPDGKIVLVEQNGNSWSFPKGGVEERESLMEAARREIREETGLTELELVGVLGSYQRKSIGKDGTGEIDEWGESARTLFLFKTSQGELVPQDGEVTQARWVTVDDAFSLLTHPKDRDFLDSVRDTIKQ